MKQFIAMALLAFAGLAQAQRQCMASAAAVPPCAAAYVSSAANSIAGCGIVDFRCQCSNSAKVQQAVQTDVISQCGGSVGQVLQSVSAECGCVSKHPKATITPNAVAKACSASALAVPPCAAGYLSSAAYYSAGCALQDFACQCSNSAVIEQAAVNDIFSHCSDIGNVLQSQSALCACVTSRKGGGAPATATTTRA